jgi:hypothetical protein
MLAAHQPDLFPYTGFWHKMAQATVFDIAAWDQFQRKGYQRRVMMGGTWASVRVDGATLDGRIVDVALAADAAGELKHTIIGRYRGSRFWKQRNGVVLDALEAATQHRKLWLFNFELILSVKSYLGIGTPVALAGPLTKTGTDGLVELCERYNSTVYLSGAGGRDYMDEAVMNRAGIGVAWSRHNPWTSDSILTTVFEQSDPMNWVRRVTL